MNNKLTITRSNFGVVITTHPDSQSHPVELRKEALEKLMSILNAQLEILRLREEAGRAIRLADCIDDDEPKTLSLESDEVPY